MKIKELWEHSGVAVTPIQARNSKAKLNKLILHMKIFKNIKLGKIFLLRVLKYLFQLFDIAHDDAIYILQQDRCRTRKMIMEDVQFLEDQR